MRIHTSKIHASKARELLANEISAGRIAPSVNFRTLSIHGSQKRGFALEIQLESVSKKPGDGRRMANWGHEFYGASYDEWGWFLAALFDADPDLTTSVYVDRADFDDRTGWTYSPAALIDYIAREGEDPYPYVNRKPLAGRQGFGRCDGEYLNGQKIQQWVLDLMTYAPRTIADVQAFAKLETVAV